MKVIIVALAFVAVAAGAAIDTVVLPPVQILRSEYDQKPEGGYLFNFESEDGIKREEVGEAVEVINEDNKPQVVVVVKGSYSYPDSDGKLETVNYWADQTGYHAEGASIPKGPVVARR